MWTIVMWVIVLGWLTLLTVWCTIIGIRLFLVEISVEKLKEHPWLCHIFNKKVRRVEPPTQSIEMSVDVNAHES